MSQDFHHQGIFSFTPPPINAPDESSQIRIREDNSNHKLRLQGLSHAPEGASASGMHPAVYETAGMLSEMLNFGGGHGGGGGVNAAGMQFFLTDPQPRSPSPPPLTHVLLPTHQQHEFMNWVDPEGGGGGVEGRGLSLSLSSPLEAAAKAEEEMRMGGGGMMFFGNHGQNQQHVMHLQGYGIGHPNPSGHFSFGSALAAPASSLGAVNSLRNSKFVKPAQELLEEFCSVGRGNLKKSKFSRNNSSISSTTSSGGAAGPSSSNSAKDSPALSPSDRMEHQRRKVKLLTMLDEMERRYSQYCEQMQMVVNSYDVVMGYGAAIPYTALAQKAMSRHFRCLKDAIQAQLKHSCELLGDKDVSTSTGLTKGETPRLKILEQSLRQQRAFHQMGMMEQEAWRPQRGLPERSVNILRAWLFEHFLHPYPSDADKHLLARQTGLSRNQVSNWFINARVRLWKPMVEDMYQQESKDGAGDGQRRHQDQEDVDDDDDDGDDGDGDEEDGEKRSSVVNSNAQTSMSAATSTAPPKRTLINAPDTDASYFAINGASLLPAPAEFAGAWPLAADDGVAGPTVLGFGASTAAAAAGDVSLTLGLRHSAAGGGQPEKSGFSFRDFGS